MSARILAVRSVLFIFSVLGVLYGFLSMVDGAWVDSTVGMSVAVAGLSGWVCCDYWEARR